MESQRNRRQPKMPTAPESLISKSPLFQELRESVAKETMAFTFACGGTIPIVSSLPDTDEETDTSEQLRATSCLPIQLRWDSIEKTTLSSQTRITLPLEPDTEKNLAQLVKDMTPATFGLSGEHVYDESYRKATKLDQTCFSSTFNPYELGIIDTIAQTLLPSLRHSKQSRSVKAELYKLNASFAPIPMLRLSVITSLTFQCSYTPVRQASSRHTSIRLGLQPSSVPWWFVFRSSTAAARWKSGTSERRRPSTRPIPKTTARNPPLAGPPSTVTASTRCWR